ncbi:hypothetical protein SAMN05216464_110105 [Mucilaginibacter pineti]|uniref:Penicillin-binding protein n=1 Tax=Mucilaginibacter pineti TaxID=1391627 RepID=A0A1G7GEB7_9SPHI|nr:penicillin-binding protein [Mucilaginibacter pineti]SDE86482.1 hypothetical protein SAMN05216464_110105 [Mucilaginibacter pineti]
MTRSNLYVTLSNGQQITCVADSSSAPEHGYIVEQLILPLLELGDAEQELALLEEHCCMNELRVNSTYRYALNLPKKAVFFYEESYNYSNDRFILGKNITNRYNAYVKSLSPKTGKL